MRLRHAALTASGICITALAIMWSGAQLVAPEPTFQVDPADVSDAELAETPDAILPDGAVREEVPEANVEPQGPSPEADSAAGEQSDTLEPAPQIPADELESEEMERLPPRPPLSGSEASQGVTSTVTAAYEGWKSTRLFKPVASSAGRVEAQGYNIVLAGIEPLAPEAQCTFEGKEWACGLRARTAFRSWLRGRAIACVIPPKPEPQPVVAECHIGNTNLSLWLVENGWAKAVSDGPFSEAGRKASDTGKGIFGRAPSESGLSLPRVADPEPMAFPQTDPVTEEPDPAPFQVQSQPPLTGPFPPAPQVP